MGQFRTQPTETGFPKLVGAAVARQAALGSRAEGSPGSGWCGGEHQYLFNHLGILSLLISLKAVPWSLPPSRFLPVQQPEQWHPSQEVKSQSLENSSLSFLFSNSILGLNPYE